MPTDRAPDTPCSLPGDQATAQRLLLPQIFQRPHPWASLIICHYISSWGAAHTKHSPQATRATKPTPLHPPIIGLGLATCRLRLCSTPPCAAPCAAALKRYYPASQRVTPTPHPRHLSCMCASLPNTAPPRHRLLAHSHCHIPGLSTVMCSLWDFPPLPPLHAIPPGTAPTYPALQAPALAAAAATPPPRCTPPTR